MWLPSKKSVPACTHDIICCMRATWTHCSSAGMLSPATTANINGVIQTNGKSVLLRIVQQLKH
jgi:hypothetical protein